jgi:hypothetical protein
MPDSMAASDSPVGADSGEGGMGPGDGGPFPLSVPQRHRIVAGNLIACAIGAQSTVECWGQSLAGVQGSHTAATGVFRTLALGIDNVDVGVDAVVCGISPSGALACAGWDGSAASSFSSCIPSGGTFVDVGASRDSLNTVWALAAQNGKVTIDGFNSTCTTTPAPASLPPATRVVVVGSYACALDAQGVASCWLTYDTDAGSSLSVPSGAFVDIASGGAGACALDASGHITCWDATGAVRTGLAFSQISVRVVQLASDEKGNNLCALADNGSVFCSPDFGASITSSFTLPAPVVEIAVGDGHLCGIKPDNTVVCAPAGCTPDCTTAITPPAGFLAAAP